MATKLKNYFPLLWEKDELMEEIRKRKDLPAVYNKWNTEQQELFFKFCTIRCLAFILLFGCSRRSYPAD